MNNTQPSSTFKNNINNGFLKFGKPFLINRRNNNVNTLKGLETSGTNPRWQTLLRNKIAFIDMLMGTGGIKPSRNFAGQATSRVRPSGQTRMPQAPIRPVTSIAIPPVDYSKVDVYCNRYSAAYLSGSGGVMDTIASTVASMYNIGISQAKILLAERCLCNGLTIGSTEPCPPANPNSPFYTTDRFCETDWCVDGQGNPLPNAHPDCRCCDDNTGTGSNIPCKYVRAEGVCQKYWSYMNNNDAQAAMQEVNQFALNEGISTPAAYALVLKCCDDSGLGEFSCERVSQDWCTKFHAAFPFGKQSQNMQGTVNPFIGYASGFGYTLTYDQAYDILLRCCGDGTSTGNNPCEDPNWTNLQWGGTIGQANYNGGKNNYCDRCSTNSQGASFPVIWQNGQWQYDPINGTNYCECCPPPVIINPDIPCGSLNEEEAICSQYLQALATTNSIMLNNVITMVATELGITNSQALAYLERCCGISASPCEGFQDNGCCGKCDNANGNPNNGNTGGLPMTSGHPCYNWCQKWGSCCPGSNATNTGTAAGGVTQAPVLPAPTMPTQVQSNNNNNIAIPTRGFDGGFMMGD